MSSLPLKPETRNKSRHLDAEYKVELDRLDTILQYELLSSKCYKDEDIAYHRFHQSRQELFLRYEAKNKLLLSELSRWTKNGKVYFPRSRI